MRRTLASALVACAFCAAANGGDAPRAASSDSVTCLDGGARKTYAGVTIESAGFDRVVFSRAGRPTTIDGADVVEVRYGDAPADFDAGVAALRLGEGDAAVAAFQAALSARATSRGWLVEQGAAGLAEAYLLLANRDAKNAEKAAHAFATARDANPRGLTLDRVLTGLARADLVLHLPDAALAASDEFAAAGKTARRPLWESAALLLRADALTAKGDSAGALRAADSAIAVAAAAASSATSPDAARPLRRATVHAAATRTRLLVAAAETTQAADAVQRARDAAAELPAKWPDEPESEAAATNAAGALLLVAGDARKALRKFVETEVAHFDVPFEAARALWYESLCHERLGDPSARADDLKRLVASYPTCEWAGRDDVKSVTAGR